MLPNCQPALRSCDRGAALAGLGWRCRLDSRVPWRMLPMLIRMPLAACISFAAAMTVAAPEPVGAQTASADRGKARLRVATAPSPAPVSERASEAAPSETMAPVPADPPAGAVRAAPTEAPSTAPAETAAPRIVEVDPLVAQVRQRLATARLGDSTAA